MEEQKDLKTIMQENSANAEGNSNPDRTHKGQSTGTKILVGILMFLVTAVIFGISYAFWGGMSQWGGPYNPNVTPPDVFYLLYIWGPILLVLLLVPTVLTFTNIRWLWKWIFWFFSYLLAFLTWMVWFVIIEVTSK